MDFSLWEKQPKISKKDAIMAEVPYILNRKFFCDKWKNYHLWEFLHHPSHYGEGWCSIRHMQKLQKQNSEESYGYNNKFPEISQGEFAHPSDYQEFTELNKNSKNKRKSSSKEASELFRLTFEVI